MVDGEGGSKEGGGPGDSAQGSGNPAANDPRLVQEAIPDFAVAEEVAEQPSASSDNDCFYTVHQDLLTELLVQKAQSAGLHGAKYAEEIAYAVNNPDDAALCFKKLELIGSAHDLSAKQRYGQQLFYLIVAWLFLVLAVVAASAIKIDLPPIYPVSYVPVITEFKLSDTVQSVLIGSTTANIIGLLVVVVRYLFPRRDGKSQGD